MTKTRIVLCMIVKNEAQVMERCLSSVLPVIDAACICDTGSTDNTITLVTDLLAAADCPARVASHEWVNFGVSRTNAFNETRAFAEELGFPLASTYSLFLDADMVLQVLPTFDAEDLVAVGYSLQQLSGTLSYQNLRLARLDCDWTSVGSTHEYWSLPADEGAVESLADLVILDIGDGGSKDDKFERDILLLEEDLERDPDNLRTIFYLAQSYFDTGRFAEAYDKYRQRADGGGWEEEGWYASYMAGRALVEMEKEQEGYGELLKSWERRPTRAEPLHALAELAQKQGDHHVAMMAAMQALRMPVPAEDRLFVDHRAYGEGVAEVLSIASFYCGAMDIGAAACDAVSLSPGAQPAMRTQAGNNSRYYAKPLFSFRNVIKTRIPDEFFEGSALVPGNISIRRSRDGYQVTNRLLNYYINGQGDFLVREPGMPYLSKHVSIRYDRNLKVRSASPIDDSVFEDHSTIDNSGRALIQGIEDMRLVRWNGEWWFSGNTSQTGPPSVARVVLGRLDQHCTRIEQLTLLDIPGTPNNEKNWMPFVHDGRLLFLYASDPTLVLEPDPETGACYFVGTHQPSLNFKQFRGSSPLVPFNGRYLGLIHEVVLNRDARVYLHRFIVLDPDGWNISHVSRPFTFLHTGVEYCCGITWAHEPGELLLSFSFEEQESRIGRIDRDQVREMLIPVERLARLLPADDSMIVTAPPTRQSPLPVQPQHSRWSKLRRR